MLGSLPHKERNGKGVYLSLSEKEVPQSPEGYVLQVSEKGVFITSSGQAGLFYGCQTLEQLMEDSRDSGCRFLP